MTRALTARELLHALTEDYVELDTVVRLWTNDVDCVVTGVRSYQGRDGELRLDVEYVNRLQVEGID